jgi:hypothetical protein
MQTFNEFKKDRKSLVTGYKLRNVVSKGLCLVLLYQLTTMTQNIFAIMGGVCLVICAYIFTMKLRYKITLKNNNCSLHEYISLAIREARLNNNYTELNKLLDSKYTSHVILLMSKLPLTAFNFKELSRWEHLPKAMSYFKKEEFTTEDLMDSVKVIGYMKNVTPDLFIK